MNNETITDIVRDIRRRNHGCPLDAEASHSTVEDLLNLADRIEAAYKQTVTDCNQSKMREALRYLRDASREFYHLILNSKHNEICDKYKYAPAAIIRDAIATANAALAEPPRNCDVGTREEQLKRFDEFCSSRSCNECPLYDDTGFIECGVQWSHLPCKKGGAE